jgi:murein DD-endopeptidase MepM/ murein hydrolase activator NlpD
LIHDGELVYELPYQPGRSFRVIQGYGGTYSHTGESHFSIDFGMPEGTPICAASGGVIYHVVEHFSEGGAHRSFQPKANAIYVLHPDDTIAAYVHLLPGGSVVRAGDQVAAGQMIGYSGNTGWSGSPHLHFHVADAFFHKHVPTRFNSVEFGITTVEVDGSYTRPKQKRNETSSVPDCQTNVSERSDKDRDAFAFSAELLTLAENLAMDLASAGYDRMSEYSSIDPMHDVHGLEVCGIRSPEVAMDITRFLLRRFPGWNAGWLHAPEDSSTQQWVASVRRDRELTMEYWDTD